MRADIHKVLARNLVNLKMNVITIETVKHYGRTIFFSNSNHIYAHYLLHYFYPTVNSNVLSDIFCLEVLLYLLSTYPSAHALAH